MVEQGRVLGGRYRLEVRLGAGGFGAVWRGFDTQLERLVAVKLLLAEHAGDATAAELFQREARAAAKLNHPNATQVYDSGAEGDGLSYLVMELVDGGSLGSRLAGAPEGLPVGQVAQWGRQAAEALAEAHRAGMVHRDIKPANLMLHRDGRVKVCDFGIARIASATGSVTAKGYGTPEYVAPEQLDDLPVDHRTDLYALGATVYHLLTGAPPFTGHPAAILHGHLNKAPAPPRGKRPDIPEPLNRLILDLLAKDPAHRPATAAETATRFATCTAQSDLKPADLRKVLRPHGMPGQLQKFLDKHDHDAWLTDECLLTLFLVLQIFGGEAHVNAVLACNPAAHVELSDPGRVAELVSEFRETGASEQLAVLLSRDIAATVTESRHTSGIGLLLQELHGLGAHEQVSRLIAQLPVEAVPLDDPRGVSDLLEGLRRAGAAGALSAVLARSPAREAALQDPSKVAQLLNSLHEVGAVGEIQTLLARDPGRHVPLHYEGSKIAARGKEELLKALRRAGAHEQAQVYERRVAAQSADGSRTEPAQADGPAPTRLYTTLAAPGPGAAPRIDPRTADLREVLRPAGLTAEIARLAAEYAQREWLANGHWAGHLLRKLRKAGSWGHVQAVLDCDPAAHIRLESEGVIQLIDSLHELGASEQLTKLLNRDIAGSVNVRGKPFTIGKMLEQLAGLGARDEAASLVARIPVAEIPFNDAYGLAQLFDGLHAAGAREQIAALLARNPARTAACDLILDRTMLREALRGVGAAEQARIYERRWA